MPIALRPRASASTIPSRWGSHALAWGLRPGGGGHGAGSESVDISVAGFADGAAPESVDTCVAGFADPGLPQPGGRTVTPAAFK